MSIKLQIIKALVKQGLGKATGKPYFFAEASAVVHGTNPESGEPEFYVGTFLLPKGQEGLKPGMYTAELTVTSGRDGKLEPRFVRLEPVVAAASESRRAAS